MSTATAAVTAVLIPASVPEAERGDGEGDHGGHEDGGDAVG